MKVQSLALEGWWSWWVDKEDPVPYSKEIVRPVSVCDVSSFCLLASPCACVCAGVRWSVKGEKGLQLGSGCQKKNPNNLDQKES